ncbi:hypothetical protein [Seleniivibrio woodruffii]|uniref:hypothetical protein n=1 Tax=Seleniivibrio woodruffii TaxID=1078050 RepID=UPI0024093AE9|nr:hypothetical protein [Seleniivibrio woodruffii]
MKFEKFITSFFMLNIILAVALVYSMKSDGILAVLEDVFYSKKVSAGYMTFSPELLGDSFRRDTETDIQEGYAQIFSETNIKRQRLTNISAIPPVERSGMIIKMMGRAGDGICLNGKSITEKIMLTGKRKGCTKDFAEVFSVLAGYTGLDTRLVKNDENYAVEVFDGKKWFYADPYHAAVAFDDKDQPMSFLQMADRISRGKHIRLEPAGLENHPFYDTSEKAHPYFADREHFASVYTLMGNNIFAILKKEAITPLKPKFVFTFAPYREIKPHWAHLITDTENITHMRKIVVTFMLVWVGLCIGTNVVLPGYFIYSNLVSRKK